MGSCGLGVEVGSAGRLGLDYNMKQVKERRERVVKKTTIVPKMSLTRQSYIKRFRRRVIREANLSLRQQIEETEKMIKRSSEKKTKKKKRKMTIDDTNIDD